MNKTKNDDHKQVKYTVAMAIGHRKTMEDKPIIAQNENSGWILFCVCDGHGGSEIVQQLETFLADALMEPLTCSFLRQKKKLQQTVLSEDMKQRRSSFLSPLTLKSLLHDSIISLDRKLHLLWEGGGKEEKHRAGSTCTVFGYNKYSKQMFTLNVGDSRTVICQYKDNRKRGEHVVLEKEQEKQDAEKKEILETQDHKPKVQKEVDRIEKAGGCIANERVDGNLALTRALGDFYFKYRIVTTETKETKKVYDPVDGVICAVPDIWISKKKPDTLYEIVVASDGIWDVLTTDQTMAFVHQHQKEKNQPADTADALVCLAFTQKSQDNMTAFVISLLPEK